MQAKAPVEEKKDKAVTDTKTVEEKKEPIQDKVVEKTKPTDEAVKDIDNNLEKQKPTMQNEEKKEVKVRNVYDDMARREEEKRKESANQPKT